MFSCRHSLNGREAVAHLQGCTSERGHQHSPASWEDAHTEVVSWLGNLAHLYYSHLYRHSVQQQEELQPGLKLEDEEELGLLSIQWLQTKTW